MVKDRGGISKHQKGPEQRVLIAGVWENGSREGGTPSMFLECLFKVRVWGARKCRVNWLAPLLTQQCSPHDIFITVTNMY